MFNKVLIAEDHQSSNISIQKTLHALGISDVDYVYYCDHALTWLKNAIREGQAYEVLITDLSFEEDSNKQTITNGVELIHAARLIQPDIKVIVFSVESRPRVIDKLFNELGINAYVRKARNDADHLMEALHVIYKHKLYKPVDVKQAIKSKNMYEFTSLDIAIVSLLHKGERQRNIPEYLKLQGVKPYSLSSVEKRINQMKGSLGFTNNEQLAVYCKEIGLI